MRHSGSSQGLCRRRVLHREGAQVCQTGDRFQEKEMLYLHRGKSKEDFKPFFKEHDSSWYKGIEGCMNKIKGDKAHCLRLQGLRLLLRQDMVCFPSQAKEDGSQKKGLGML